MTVLTRPRHAIRLVCLNPRLESDVFGGVAPVGLSI